MNWVRQVPAQELEWLVYYYTPSNKNNVPGIDSRFTVSKDTSNNIFTLDMKNMRSEDTAIYYCARKDYGINSPPEYLTQRVSLCYAMGYWGQGTMVKVTAEYYAQFWSAYYTEYTVHNLALFKCQVSVNLTAKNLLKYKDTLHFLIIYFTSNVNKMPSRKRPERIIVPPIVLLLLSSTEQIISSRYASAMCSIIELRPKSLTVNWLKSEQLLDSGFTTSPAFEMNRNVLTASRLTLPDREWFTGSVYTCQVTHEWGTQSRNFSRSQAKDPREPAMSVLLPSAEEVSAQRLVSLTCLVRGFSPREIFVKRTVNDKLVDYGNYKNTEVMAENGSSSFFMYSLLSIAAKEWASGDSHSCVVGHEVIPLIITNRTVNKSSVTVIFIKEACLKIINFQIPEECLLEEYQKKIEKRWDETQVQTQLLDCLGKNPNASLKDVVTFIYEHIKAKKWKLGKTMRLVTCAASYFRGRQSKVKKELEDKISELKKKIG
uniref:immunoglobulin gamma-1 heavy chain-like n=1 Tax=Pristiophorus japonicus TaxID=55135 RepID=UPI00398E9489